MSKSGYVNYFESNLKLTSNDLKRIYKEEDKCIEPKKDSYKKKMNAEKQMLQSPTTNFFNYNINNTNVENYFELNEYIKQNNDLLDNDKNKLKNALNELDKLKNENDSNDKKWNKIKVIIKLVLEYGPKYFSLFYPKISEAIATIRLNL